MFDFLVDFDIKAFLFLNSLHSPAWDSIMMWISGTKSWIPLYIILLAAIVHLEQAWYRFIFTILFVAVTVVLCDQISVFIKDLVERPRPTYNQEIAHMVHVVNDYRGGRFGFVSSHAANVFGVAAFLSSQFKSNKWGIFLFTWATLVSYSRIYLGVHYPLDIIFGGLLGTMIGIQFYVFKVHTAVFIEHKIKKIKSKSKSKK